MITQERAKGFYEFVIRLACNKFYDEGVHEPMAIGLTADSKMALMPMTWMHDEKDKHVGIIALKEAAKRFNIKCFVFIHEAYMNFNIERYKEYAKKNDPTKDLSSVEGTEECLMINLETAIGSTFTIFRIIRKEGDKPKLEKLEWKQPDNYTGPFTDIIKEDRRNIN